MVFKFIDDLEWNIFVLIRQTFLPSMALETMLAPKDAPGLPKVAIRLARITRRAMNQLRFYAIEQLGLVALFFNL